jgi:hypothetical protein
MVGPSHTGPCIHVPATPHHPRDYYQLDKTRVTLLTCAMIRLHRLAFFNYDYISKDDPGLLHDFLNLTQDKVTTAGASEIYRISKAKGTTDDFASAVTLGCVGIWHKTGWPNLLQRVAKLSKAEHDLYDPDNPDWGE